MSSFTTSDIEERLRRLEQQVEYLVPSLNSVYLLGRLRFDRNSPANSADIVAGVDLLYDIVRDSNYEYILINNAGTLAWVRISMSSF